MTSIIQSSSSLPFADKQEKIDELEKLLKQSSDKQKIVEEELSSKDVLIADLKKQLRHNEKKFHEELKKKHQQVLALKVEIDNKGSTIAYLTTEMHKLQIIRKSNEFLSHGPVSPPSGDQTSYRRTVDVHALQINPEALTDIPISPPSGESQSTRRRTRKSSASDIRSRPVTSRSNKPRPDAAEALLANNIQAEPEVESVAVKPTPPVLPPITPGGDDINKKAFSRRQQLLKRRLELKSQPEYGKLAVDKITTSSNNTWVHEPNTTPK